MRLCYKEVVDGFLKNTRRPNYNWEGCRKVKKRMLTVLMVVVMLLSLAVPGFAQEPNAKLFVYGYESTDVLHRGDLAVITVRMAGLEDEVDDAAAASCPFGDVDKTADYAGYVTVAYNAGLLNGTSNTEFDPDKTVTQEQAATAVLRYAGMKNTQLGSWPYDYNATAESMGLTKGLDYNPTAPATIETIETMITNSKPLYDAMHAAKKSPLIIDGMAQPIFEYTSGIPAEGETYSNEDSEIIRYCVYVETNYDTDGDGKLDLVKVLVQVPRAAVEGDYKAATIYEARPYITGCTSDDTPYVEGEYDISSMYSQPAARKTARTATTAEAAAAANSEDWYYWNPQEQVYDYEDLTWYDYYLVRGFAVVECGGLGTKGSDGFETCGSDLEIDAFKCVIEWLHGDRVAYTDKESNVAIKADWSSGNVGMTGRSYAGTTQFGLATTGVAGLKTIVPVAGIASWYEYTKSQGITTGRLAYSDNLAWYCAGRYLDEADYATIADKYGRYLYQINQDQLALNGDYGEHWVSRDYTLNASNIKIPALIVHGLNDDNVRTKQFDLMYKSFTKAGQNVKLLLHQGTHLTPTYPAQETEMYIDGQLYDEILNKWFCHYLLGVNNGIENMSKVTAQSNVDGSWQYYDSWDENTKDLVLKCSDSTDAATTTISADNEATGATSETWRNMFTSGSTASSAMYTMTVDKDTVISGAVEVHITASSDTSADALKMSAMLVDIDENGFMTYTADGSYLPNTVIREEGAWMGGGLKNFDLVKYAQTEATYKIVARGWIDLCNPDAGYYSNTAADSIVLVPGENHEYTVYLQPNLYTVKEGHTLALVIYTNEPTRSSANPETLYNITIDNAATYAVLPVR